MSHVLIKNFVSTPGALYYPVEVKIIDDHTVRAPSVHRECILKFFREKYPIDLVFIPLRATHIFVGMEWLS